MAEEPILRPMKPKLNKVPNSAGVKIVETFCMFTKFSAMFDSAFDNIPSSAALLHAIYYVLTRSEVIAIQTIY
jgi:hypothetical protein